MTYSGEIYTMHKYRTHTCGELRISHSGIVARLSGWVFRKRDHGSLLFIDLCDRYGVTQVVIQPDCQFFELSRRIKLESVITVTGTVRRRSEDTINPKIPTGEVELLATEFEVLNYAENLPFQVDTNEDLPEELRLKYRFLDLRREKMQSNILLRSNVIWDIRQRMIAHGFTEIQTPILTSSSPEGARDFLVPSRLHRGKFYALPQSPQQFKQLLMSAGFDKYFQIAPCFRDEDSRADRSPGEHYQLDIEMSFVTQEDIFNVVESVLYGVFTKFSNKKVDKPPFMRIPYKESILKYGTDKPDLRISLEAVDVTDVFAKSGFRAFQSIVQKGGVVRVLPVPKFAGKSRSFFDRMEERAKELGGKGLGYIIFDNGEAKGPIAKFLTNDEMNILRKRCNVRDGHVIFFVCDNEKLTNHIVGQIRIELGQEAGLFEKDVFKFCWITDFPMFEKDEETGAIQFCHNPFSLPHGGIESVQKSNPLQITAYQYDIVCNGCEIGSGAIRNHDPEIMYKVFEIAGYSREEVENKFPALLNAFKLGTPPHGGIAPGIDRIIMLLSGAENIREVIAFPLNQRAQDLMMNAPSEVSEKQLREVHIRIRKSEDKPV